MLPQHTDDLFVAKPLALQIDLCLQNFLGKTLFRNGSDYGVKVNRVTTE